MFPATFLFVFLNFDLRRLTILQTGYLRQSESHFDGLPLGLHNIYARCRQAYLLHTLRYPLAHHAAALHVIHRQQAAYAPVPDHDRALAGVNPHATTTLSPYCVGHLALKLLMDEWVDSDILNWVGMLRFRRILPKII